MRLIGHSRRANAHNMVELGLVLTALRGRMGRPQAAEVASQLSGEDLSDEWLRKLEEGRVSVAAWELRTLAQVYCRVTGPMRQKRVQEMFERLRFIAGWGTEEPKWLVLPAGGAAA